MVTGPVGGLILPHRGACMGAHIPVSSRLSAYGCCRVIGSFYAGWAVVASLSTVFFASLKEATVASLLKCNCRFACHLGNRRSGHSHALRRNCPSSTLAGTFFYGLADADAYVRARVLRCLYTPCASSAILAAVACSIVNVEDTGLLRKP